MLRLPLLLLALCPCALGHSPHDVVAALAAKGDFVAVVVRNQLFASTDAGMQWRLATRGLPTPTYADHDQYQLVLAPGFDHRGAERTIFLFLLPRARNGAPYTFGGTGLYMSTDAAYNWRYLLDLPVPMRDELGMPRLCPLAAYAPRTHVLDLFLATPGGLYHAPAVRSSGGTTGVPAAPLHALHAGGPGRTGRELAPAPHGGGGGSAPRGRLSLVPSFSAAALAPPTTVLVTGTVGGTIFVGTVSGAVLRSTNGGKAWTSIARASTEDAVVSLTSAGATGGLVAGVWPAPRRQGHGKHGGGAGAHPALVLLDGAHTATTTTPRHVGTRIVSRPELCGAAAVGHDELIAVGGRVWRGSIGRNRSSWHNVGESAGLYTLDQAAVFRLQNFTHVVAAGPRRSASRPPRLYIGSFTGAYRSDDGGRVWFKLDPLSSLMQSLVVAPSAKANHAQLELCTHRLGCWHGEVSLAALHAGAPIEARALSKGYPGALGGCHGSSRVYSPNYAEDGVVFASCAAPPRLYRSEDRGLSWSSEIPLPLSSHFPSCSIDNAFTCRAYVIQGYAFSPAFGRGSSVLYLAGYALGVAKSIDGGRTFVTVMPSRTIHGILKACKVVVAPHSEQVVVAMATFGQLPSETMSAQIDGETSVRGHRPSRLFLSIDGGASWRPMEAAPAAWENIVFGAALSGASVLLGIRTSAVERKGGGLMRGELVAHDCRNPAAPFSRLHVDQPPRSEGFGYQGLHALPGGRVLVSFLQGGTAVVRIDVAASADGVDPRVWPLDDAPSKVTSKVTDDAPSSSASSPSPASSAVRIVDQYHSGEGLWNLTSPSPMWSFSLNNHPPDNMMRYSSTPTVGYVGGILFGASYYSVMISLDYGRTWRRAHSLTHSSDACGETPVVTHCKVCMATEPRDCAVCEEGYVRTPWPDSFAAISGTAATSRRCCHAQTGQC